MTCEKGTQYLDTKKTCRIMQCARVNGLHEGGGVFQWMKKWCQKLVNPMSTSVDSTAPRDVVRFFSLNPRTPNK